VCVFRGNIASIKTSKSFELYALREDLTINPIPERADQMRTQATNESGLCKIEIPAYNDTNDGFLDSVVLSVTGTDCSIDVCRSEECHACTKKDGEDLSCALCSSSSDCDGLEDVVEYRHCECDAVVTVNEKNEFTLYTGELIRKKIDGGIHLFRLQTRFLVSYKPEDVPNDIKLIGIFDEIEENKTLKVTDHYGLFVNNPIHPDVIPRFSTMAEFTAKISQVITDFTSVPTNITAIYTPGTDDSYGKFNFGIHVEKAFEHEVSFSSSVSIGDFSTLSVEESSLYIGGSFMLDNEFGVILGPDDTKGLKITAQIDEATNCTSSNKDLTFDIILYHDNDPPIAHNISIKTCAEGAAARVDTIRKRVNKVVGEEDVTVSLVGTKSLVLAFNPYWSKVELYGPKQKNIYGLPSYDKQKKSGWYFANGATELDDL
jgi:hypothetical protein